jgi:glutathione-specific gamma-glutamylcyclotransferase
MDKTDWQQKRQLKLTEVPVKSVHRDVADTGYDGSGADYLHQTLKSLEASGIHDPYLWQLQELVARRIMARYRNL